MKKIMIPLLSIVFLLCAWLLVEYKEIADAAEQQVANDILWLESEFNSGSSMAGPEHQNKKHLQTVLVQQSINEKNQFLRHYRSLFIREGEKTCLTTSINYQDYKAKIEEQIWSDANATCIP